MNESQQGKVGPAESSRSIPISRSLDFQRLRNSFMRKPKKKEIGEESPSASLRDLCLAASGENISDGGKKMKKGTGSLTDTTVGVETTGLLPYDIEAASRESLKDKFLNRMRGLSNSKDEIGSAESKSKVSPRRSLSVNAPRRVSLFDRVKELYNSKEVLDNADMKGSEFHDSQWTGVVLLNKLYNKEEKKVKSSEDNGPVNMKTKSKVEDSYWKGVRFLDKAQDIYEHQDEDDFQDQIQVEVQSRNATDRTHGEQRPAEASEDPQKKESLNQGSRRHARPRGSIVSLNGSLHSLSSLPSSPPPGSGYVIRNSKFASQKRGKVARQAFQVYPKSFNQMKKKLSKRFSGRRKVSTLIFPAVGGR